MSVFVSAFEGLLKLKLAARRASFEHNLWLRFVGQKYPKPQSRNGFKGVSNWKIAQTRDKAHTLEVGYESEVLSTRFQSLYCTSVIRFLVESPKYNYTYFRMFAETLKYATKFLATIKGRGKNYVYVSFILLLPT